MLTFEKSFNNIMRKGVETLTENKNISFCIRTFVLNLKFFSKFLWVI